MRRLTTALGLVLALIAGVLVAGCGDDKSGPPVAGPATTSPPATTTATATTPPATRLATTPHAATTQPTTKHSATKQTTTKTPPTRTQPRPPLESSPQVLARRSKARAKQAAAAGARSCPNLSTPAEAKDITVLHISCKTARAVIFADKPSARKGFVCDIVDESFSAVPAVEYACNRKADAAELGYTAVG